MLSYTPREFLRFSLCLSFALLTIPAIAQRGRQGQAPAAPAEQEVRVSSRAYEPGMGATSSVALLPVVVAVRDSHGRAVADLKSADFVVTDQGKEGAVASVVPVKRPRSGTPRFLAMCFDDYGSSQGQLLRAKSIAIQFVKEGMEQGDLVSISSTFSNRLTPFTGDKAVLVGAIERLEQHAVPSMQSPQRRGNFDIPGVTGVGGRGGTPQTTAAQASLTAGGEFVALKFIEMINSYDNEFSHMAGNRSILILSPGFLGVPEREQDNAINHTAATNVVINVLDSKSAFREVGAEAEGAGGYSLPAAAYTFDVGGLGVEAGMAEFAHSTGGLFFHHDGDPFSHGYHELADVPETSYLVGLRGEEGDKYRRLKVQLKSPGNFVEARTGYFPSKDAPPAPASSESDSPAMRAKLDAQVDSMTPVTGFPFTVAIKQYSKLPNGKTGVEVMLHTDMKALTFGTRNGRHTQKLTLVAAIFDESGKRVSAKEGVMEFNLTDAKLTQIQGEGVTPSLTLEAEPGTYRLCTVGQDAEGKLASTVNKIQVP